MVVARLRSPWVPVAASLAGAASLVGPWARSGRVDRSSVELLATAGALDVLSGAERLAAVVAWYLVVVAAAFALVAAAWGRTTLAMWPAVLVGPALVGAWLIVARSPLTVRWAAPLGALMGLTASATGILVLMRRTGRAEGKP